MEKKKVLLFAQIIRIDFTNLFSIFVGQWTKGVLVNFRMVLLMSAGTGGNRIIRKHPGEELGHKMEAAL